jgi:hypothetical protein
MDRKDERDLFTKSMLRIAEKSSIEIPKIKQICAVLEKRKPTRN